MMRIKRILKKIFMILLKVFIGLFALVAVFCAVTAVINSVLMKKNISYAQSFDSVVYEQQLVPGKDTDGYTVFVTDDNFKIMQLTDIHIGGGWLSYNKDRMALNAVAAMVTAEKPDLVVVTGDIAYPTPQAMTLNNKSSARLFATLMERLGVYWTLVLGNHDTEAYSRYSREIIGNLYESEEFAHCLFEKGPEDVDGIGNYVINVENSQGVITQSLIMLDSHSYTDKDYFGVFWKYDNLHENQVNWYSQQVKDLSKKNDELKKSLGISMTKNNEIDFVSSLVFLHIPLTEYLDAYTEYMNNGYKDTANVSLIHGIIGENPEGKMIYCGIHKDNFFESLYGTKAVFCGHDHLNNIALKYKGVMLCYGMSIDYLAYIGISDKGAQRGCTVITSTPNSEITVKNENYYQDKYVSQYEKEKVDING